MTTAHTATPNGITVIAYAGASIRVSGSKLGEDGDICRTVRDWPFCIDFADGYKILDGGNESKKTAIRRAKEMIDARRAALAKAGAA
jgi:hypothetical protein